MTPRETILTQLVIDGMRRLYRAIEHVEKEVGWTIDVLIQPEALWWEPGDKFPRKHDEPYVTICWNCGDATVILLDSSYGAMVKCLEKGAREDEALGAIDHTPEEQPA